MAHLGGFSEEALLLFQHAASEQGYDFSESGDTYDFTRCVRPDGSFYGTQGRCKKGKDAGEKEAEGPRTAGGKKRRATAEAKKEAKAASRKAAGEKVSANAARTRLLKEELEKVKDKMKGAPPEEQNRLIQEASRKANERAAAPKMGDSEKKSLQDRASRGDKEAMNALTKARSEGKIGKEPGFAPGQKARNEAKETANVKAGKSPVADVKPARKPRATASELKASQSALFDDAKAKRAAAKEAEREAKRVEGETKGDKSPGARKRRLEAGRAWDKASTAADRAQRKWMKEHDRWSKASGREQRAKMSPAQRAETRKVDNTIRKLG